MDIQHESVNCKLVLPTATNRKNVYLYDATFSDIIISVKMTKKIPVYIHGLIAYILSNRGRTVHTYIMICRS